MISPSLSLMPSSIDNFGPAKTAAIKSNWLSLLNGLLAKVVDGGGGIQLVCSMVMVFTLNPLV